MSAKGITLNLVMTNDDDNCNLKVNCDTTDGFNFDYNIMGDDLESMFEECIDDFSEEVIKYITQKEKEEQEKPSIPHEKELERIIQELTKENNSLKADNEVLQKRIDDVLNKPKNTKSKPKDVKTNVKKSIPSFFDDEWDFLFRHYL